MEKYIYLDYNATTPVDKEVVQAMLPFIHSDFGNPSSSYAIGRYTKNAISQARKHVADLLNAQPNEIIFNSGGTESNNQAIQGVAFASQEKGRHIITSAVEHPAVTEVCKYLASLGWDITYIPVDKYGAVNPHDIEKAIRPDTVLITIMHANNEVGTIQPIREIGEIAKKHNVIFHTDAAQSVGKIETDVQQLGVDLLTVAGHKLYAPKGIGALYVKRGTQVKNLMYGAGQEKGFRPGTENVPYIVSIGKACEIARRDFIKNTENMKRTRDNLLTGLKKKLDGGVFENVELSNCLPNTLSVSFNDIEAHSLASAISNTIFISTGSACHADSIEISAVLKAMNIKIMQAAGTVRISTGKHTTGKEIDKAIDIISEAVNKLKQKI